MNIFILDTDIVKCAQYHNDKHVVKMILESTQLLNNALLRNNKDYSPIYRKTHFNHPCSIWAAESYENFQWLLKMAIELCKEYTFRYDKHHKCENYLYFFENKYSCFPRMSKISNFKQCMPDEHRGNDTVVAYRKYYAKDKLHIAAWRRRGKPYWWEEYTKKYINKDL